MHARRTTLVAALLASLMIVAPSALAQSFGPLEDASGNGLDLNEVGAVEDAIGSVNKFGNGLTLDATEELDQTNPAYDLVDEQASFLLAFDVNGSQNVRVSIEDSGGLYRLVANDAQIQFLYDTSSGQEACSLTYTATQSVSAWVTIEPGGLVSDTVVTIDGYADGVGLTRETCSEGPDPSSNTFEQLSIGLVAPTQAVNVTEIRIWDTLISHSTLDTIANPQNTAFQFAAQGDETGLYFLENVTVGEITQPIEAHVHVLADNEIVQGDPLHVDVFVTNRTGERVIPPSTPTMTVVRITDDAGWQSWDPDASAWTSERTEINLTASTVDFSLFEATVTPTGSGVWNVYSNVKLEATQGPPAEVNLTGDHNVAVSGADVPVEIAGLDASALIHLGVAGIFFLIAAWEGWVFPMFAGLVGTPAPIFQAQGVAYPIGFQAFILLALLAVMLQVFATRSKLGDGRGNTASGS